MFQAPEITEYKKLADKFHEEATIAKEILSQAHQTLNSYKQQCQKIDSDSDGIYILVQGSVKLVNKVERDQELCQIGLNECFGDSKYVNEPSATFFGDVIAAVSDQDTVTRTVPDVKSPTVRPGKKPKLSDMQLL